MTYTLRPADGTFGEAFRALGRALAEARQGWDDEARRSFDRQFTDPIMTSGQRIGSELHELAHELGQAVRVLDDLG